MNTKVSTLRALAAIMNEEGLSTLELKEPDFYIRLEKPTAAAPAAAAVPAPIAAPAAAPVPAPAPAVPEEVPGHLVNSPMVGVFYAAPAPDRDPFVTVGSRVKAGDVLCIVEAMKLMNELTADRDGEIAEILAANGDVVEFGQPLFRLV